MIGIKPFIIKDGKVQDLKQSEYQPSDAVKGLTGLVLQDAQVGVRIQNTAYTEFNDKTPLQRTDISQRQFNAYVWPKSEDPDEAWRSNVVRPLTRNKIITILAHMISRVMIPRVFPHNRFKSEDRAVADAMRDIVEWNIKHSTYNDNMLFFVAQMLANICGYLSFEWTKSKIPARALVDGDVSIKEALDDLASGLQINNVPVEEVLITNIYQYDHQRQRAVMHNRFNDLSDIKARYAGHPNLKFIKPGVRIIFNPSDSMFYEQYDETNPTLCNEFIYRNRGSDLEVPFVNGVFMGNNLGNPFDNPMKHRRVVQLEDGTVVTIPCYPEVKGGYEPIDERRFYYYKSATFKLTNEQNLEDKLWRLRMDIATIQGMPPMGKFGGKRLRSSVFVPGRVTTHETDSRIENLAKDLRPDVVTAALRDIEASADETLQPDFAGGVPASGGRTAFEIARIEQNSKIKNGLFGMMMRNVIRDAGMLMIDEIIMHQTVGQFNEVVGDIPQFKFQDYVLHNVVQNGRKVTKRIVLTHDMPDEPFQRDFEDALLDQEEAMGEDVRIIMLNPIAFTQLGFRTDIDVDELLPRNEELERALLMEIYDRAIANPLIVQVPERLEIATKELLFEPKFRGESERFFPAPAQPAPTPGATPAAPGQSGLISQITNRTALKGLLTNQTLPS